MGGAGNNPAYWTNPLTQDAFYRVFVQNGACPAAYSNIKVTVKPPIAAQINGCTLLCPPPSGCVLTITTNYAAYCPAYQWYLDGLPITGATGSTLSVTQPGNYYAMVYDNTCSASVKTNVLKVCKPELAITAPCGLCQGQTGMLNAVFTGCTPPGCIYTWKKNNVVVSGANGASLAFGFADLNATYAVKVVCGSCEFNATYFVQKCP
jgi:hypothetical protein